MKVFYDDRQTVESNISISPSAGKPAKAVKEWQKLVNVELMPVTPVTIEDLCLVHDENFVKGVLSCEIANGFDNHSQEIADSLLWTNGSFVSAARYAAQNKVCTVSPTSGFHHATYGKAMGFCTFNGLMLAAVLLKKEGLSERIAIADIDMHYGNGTDDIIRALGIDYVSHYTFGRYTHIKTRADQQAYIDSLPEVMDVLFRRDPDILFYQAGADPHEDDPYGGALTTQNLKDRDRIVFEKAKEKGIPVVWNLAGGYQPDLSKVLEIHNNTALMHKEVFGD